MTEEVNLTNVAIVIYLASLSACRGLHQEKQAVRSRCYYLFNRFIHTARAQLTQHLNGSAVTDICSRVGDLLTIEVSLPPPETPGEDTLSRAAARGSVFDSQLYLFEALGKLISMLDDERESQVGLLRVSVYSAETFGLLLPQKSRC